MTERSDEARRVYDAYDSTAPYGSGAGDRAPLAKALKALLDEHERMEEVLDVARGFLATSGSFIAADGYVSIAVGDATPLRKVMAQFDGYETKVPDQERVYDD